MRKTLTVGAMVLGMCLVSCSQNSPAPSHSSSSPATSTLPSQITTPPKVSATPLNLPDNQAPAAPDSHIPAGTWGFVKVPSTKTPTPSATNSPDDTASPNSSPSSTPAAETIIGVRLNGQWHGPKGSLAERHFEQPPGQNVNLANAVPHYLSYSYVVISGDPEAAPRLSLLPTTGGQLYEVTSALIGGRACPDYPGPSERGIGHEVRWCIVSLSEDGAHPTGITAKVPGSDNQFWFFDGTESKPLV